MGCHKDHCAWAAIGVLILLLCGCQSTTVRPPGHGITTLRVMTWNIRHGQGMDGRVDLARIAAVINAADADIVALQEVDKSTGRSGQVDQAAELAHLTGMTAHFGFHILYDGGEYGLALLSKLPLEDVAVFRLPGNPERESRIAQLATLRLKDGTPLRLINTHLNQKRDGINRLTQARALNEPFTQRSTDPIILMGDMNAMPTQPALVTLKKRWSLSPPDMRLPTFPADLPVREIDYILFRPADRFRVRDSRVITESLASDHRPLIITLDVLHTSP